MIINMAGGGGAGLNFKVVGGTTQPTGAENLIWVNTSDDISEWVFSSTQPSSPTAGMVWFQTGTISAVKFNALKNNNVTVYPVACKQYVSGAWVSKTAKTYQSGIWRDWTVYLYDTGNQYTDITGGWVEEATNWAGMANTWSNKFSIESTTLQYSATGNASGAFRTVNKINLNGLSTIRLTGVFGKGTQTYLGRMQLAVWDVTASNAAVYNEVSVAGLVDVSIDVSSLTDSYYVGVRLKGANSTGVVLNASKIECE